MCLIFLIFTVQTSKTNLLDIDNDDDSPPPQQKVVKVKLHLLLKDSMDVSLILFLVVSYCRNV